MEFEIPDDYNAGEVLFQNLKGKRKNKVAVYCEGMEVTYADLAAMAARAGNGLLEFGLGSGDRVMLLLLDSPEFPAAFFGALRAGLTPVPVDTGLRSGDYEYFLKDSQARAILVSGPLYEKLEPIRDLCPDLEQVVVTGEEIPPNSFGWTEWAEGADPELPPAPTSPDEPAFWLYSSGAAGSPKAVVHCHGHIPFTADSYAKQVLEISEKDVTFSASKAFQAYGLGNGLTFPFSVGASTVLYPKHPEPEAVLDCIERYSPTLLFAVPSLYAALLSVENAHKRWDLSSLRLCVSAAEPLPAQICKSWSERFEVEILDGLGSTEMLHIFISNRPGEVRPGSSGRVVPGYDIRLVNEQGWPVPPGRPGELLVRGLSSFSQYWNRPEETERVQLENWVVTGERYVRDDEGCYYPQGRSDDMLKVNGNWVSPREVEDVLMEHPSVLECAIASWQDGDGLVKPKAFVVLEKGRRASKKLTKALQDLAKSRLAPYKCPRQVEFVKSLPKTADGKIRRRKLGQEEQGAQ